MRRLGRDALVPLTSISSHPTLPAPRSSSHFDQSSTTCPRPRAHPACEHPPSQCSALRARAGSDASRPRSTLPSRPQATARAPPYPVDRTPVPARLSNMPTISSKPGRLPQTSQRSVQPDSSGSPTPSADSGETHSTLTASPPSVDSSPTSPTFGAPGGLGSSSQTQGGSSDVQAWRRCYNQLWDEGEVGFKATLHLARTAAAHPCGRCRPAQADLTCSSLLSFARRARLRTLDPSTARTETPTSSSRAMSSRAAPPGSMRSRLSSPSWRRRRATYTTGPALSLRLSSWRGNRMTCAG